MCVFMGAMMLLVFLKRVKFYESATMWGNTLTVVVLLATLKFVN